MGRGSFTPGLSQIPDVSLSTYPARATPEGLPAFHRHLRAPPVASWPCGAVWVTCPLRFPGVTLVPRYYGAVRPSPAHRYFRPRGSTAWAFSLGIAGKVLTFPTGAQIGVTPPEHRTPHGQYAGIRHAAPRPGVRVWFWCRLKVFDASTVVRLRSSPQPPPDVITVTPFPLTLTTTAFDCSSSG